GASRPAGGGRRRPGPRPHEPGNGPWGEGLAMSWEEAKDVRIVTKNFGVRDSHRLSVYTQRGGFQAFRKALSMQPAALTEEVKKSNLRGRGGVRLPAGVEGRFTPQAALTRL